MSPLFKAFLFFYLAATVAFSAVVFFYTRNYETPVVLEPSDHRPNIRHCFDQDVDLWDCIIHKEKKK